MKFRCAYASRVRRVRVKPMLIKLSPPHHKLQVPIVWPGQLEEALFSHCHSGRTFHALEANPTQ